MNSLIPWHDSMMKEMRQRNWLNVKGIGSMATEMWGVFWLKLWLLSHSKLWKVGGNNFYLCEWINEVNAWKRTPKQTKWVSLRRIIVFGNHCMVGSKKWLHHGVKVMHHKYGLFYFWYVLSTNSTAMVLLVTQQPIKIKLHFTQILP